MSRLDDLREFMQAEVAAINTLRPVEAGLGFVYAGPKDLVLKEGREFDPQPLPKRIAERPMKACFSNAFFAARASQARGGDWQYVEGYALAVFIPVLHAWVWSPSKGLIDPTWADRGEAYLGLTFPLKYVERCLWGSGQWSVLDNWPAGYPLLKQPWANTLKEWGG